jgi:hypothetical protein
MLMLLVSGCSIGNSRTVDPVVPVRAVCTSLGPLVSDHADALIADGGPMSLQTGVLLIGGFDGACQEPKGDARSAR